VRIKSWWFNRVLLYWIPVIFVYDLIPTMSRYGIGPALTNLVIAALIVVFFEHFLFSYEVKLTASNLEYSEGLLARKNVVIRRDDIRAASFLMTPVFTKVQSARLVVTTRDGADFVLSLASFRPSDVRKIIGWLPAKPTT
jgi:hypothetical protein